MAQKDLIPFKKGKGELRDPRINVTGENRGSKWLTNQLEYALRQIGEGSKDTYHIMLIKRLMKKAIVEGDMRAIELIWDRIEGDNKDETNKTLILMVTGETAQRYGITPITEVSST